MTGAKPLTSALDRSLKTALIFFLTALLTLALTGSGPRTLEDARSTGASSFSFKRSEKCFMRKANDFRRKHGKRALQADRQLGYAAREAAKRIAAGGLLTHLSTLHTWVTGYTRFGDNVGKGGNCRGRWRALKKS